MISIITWDASFREHFHVIDYFCSQEYGREQFEFIWVDFYRNDNPLLLDKIAKYPNARVLNLDNERSAKWHLGTCVNAGINVSRGEILVIPDGDIVAPPNLLRCVEVAHSECANLVMYFRRWDEPADKHDEERSYDIDYLKGVCILTNPTNYGGTISLRRDTLAKVGGYEEDPVFAGPGAAGMELYIRLRNAGLPIKWHSEKIYHPGHVGTGWSNTDRELLNRLAAQYRWINPYSGVEQSWVIRCRELDLHYMANDGNIDQYLSRLPSIKGYNVS